MTRGWRSALCSIVAAVSCGSPHPTHGPSVSFSGGGMTVDVEVASAPARQGPNELRVSVRDSASAPVGDAQVEVRYSMNMAGMAPMGGRTTGVPLGRGEYRVELGLEMAGTWELALSAARASGEAARASGSLRTGDNVIRLADGTSPEADKGVVRVEPERLQKLGIRFAEATRKNLVRHIHALGRVTWDETRLVDVAPKVSGFARDLRADALGARVVKGEPLFSTYSPELYAAQAEFLQAAAAGDAALTKAARARLRLWSVSDADIAAIQKRGEPFETLPVRSPASGFVIEKNVVEGAAYAAGSKLIRIAPLDRVWIEAQIYASDLPFVGIGQRAAVTAPYLPRRSLDAKVATLLPSLSPDTRTARVRLELDNGDLALRPEMFVDVDLEADLGERLVVPSSAVIVSGEQRVVFVDLGEGRLQPKRVEIGATGPDEVEVLSGLEPGERVVASGNFLIAAESRIQSALEQW